MRKTILAILGLILVAAAILIAKWIIDSNVEEETDSEIVEKPVYIHKVENQTIPVNLSTNGSVEAVNKFELFAEVEGVFQDSRRNFRPGQQYKKGEVLIELNKREFAANV